MNASRQTIEIKRRSDGRYEVNLLTPARGGSVDVACRGIFAIRESAEKEAMRMSSLYRAEITRK